MRYLYAFSVIKDGTINQVEIDLSATAPTGRTVRSMKLATQAEGCVVDPRTARLYVGEEDRGIWRFDARPNGAVAGQLVAMADGKHLHADVEGLTLDQVGDDGGYLIASSQGDNAFAIYRLPEVKPAGRFRVVAGEVGSTEETDGIALEIGDFGPQYPGGLLVVQDGDNKPTQNFKLIAWDDVMKAVSPAN